MYIYIYTQRTKRTTNEPSTFLIITYLCKILSTTNPIEIRAYTGSNRIRRPESSPAALAVITS